MPSHRATTAPAIHPTSASGPPSAATTSGMVISGPIPIIVMTLIATAPRKSIARFSSPIGRPLRVTNQRAMHERSEIARLLRLEGDARIDFLDSKALAGNPLGDPATRPVAVYLPPGYDARRFATLSGPLRAPRLYRRCRRAGFVAPVGNQRHCSGPTGSCVKSSMPPALIVLVDGFTRLGGSQYVDSIHNGDYATYTVRDVVGHVDAQLPNDRRRRRPRGAG